MNVSSVRDDFFILSMNKLLMKYMFSNTLNEILAASCSNYSLKASYFDTLYKNSINLTKSCNLSEYYS